MIEGRHYIQNKEFGFLSIQQIHGTSYTNNADVSGTVARAFGYATEEGIEAWETMPFVLPWNNKRSLMRAWRCSR
jgi:hypothetical protein